MTRREYHHSTCTLRLETQLAPANATEFSLSYPFRTLVELARTALTGEGQLARDLVSVVERYVQAYVRGEPQGIFSSTVAIRPLDFLSHRLTIREGDSIKQADLSMTELYDLAEVLADFQQEFPQIGTWTPPSKRPKGLKSPGAVAALLVGAVSVTVGVSAWNNRNSFIPAASDSSVTLTAQGDPPASRSESLSPSPDLAAVPATESAVTGQASIPAQDPADLLRQRLLAAWRTPALVTEELVYQVTVDPQGRILSAVPQDEVAKEAQLLTPFAAAPTTPAEGSEGSQVFTVRFGELNRVVVER